MLLSWHVVLSQKFGSRTHPLGMVLTFWVLSCVCVCVHVCVYFHRKCGHKKSQYFSFSYKWYLVSLQCSCVLKTTWGKGDEDASRNGKNSAEPLSDRSASPPPYPHAGTHTFLWALCQLKCLSCLQLTLQVILRHASYVTMCQITKIETTIIWKNTSPISSWSQPPFSSYKISFICGSFCLKRKCCWYNNVLLHRDQRVK